MKRRIKIQRATVRITDADDAILSELRAALPTLRATTAIMRYGLKIARWHMRQIAAGGTICVRLPDGRIVDAPIDW